MSALHLWDTYPLEASERLLEGLADPLRGKKPSGKPLISRRGVHPALRGQTPSAVVVC